uniref:5'-nucleotidase n=1 Tax=Corethrella appendiculata TaxID=1370023 RepID=U5EYF0_9DIPT
MVGQATKLHLDEIKILNSEHVKIKDRIKVEHMINEMIYGGRNKLQVVSDFDYTITKQRLNNGEKVLSSFGMFNCCKSLPSDVIKESQNLFNKYRPIEIDPHMPTAEKVIFMIEWWTKTGDLLKGFSLAHNEIDDVAVRFKDGLRDGTHELFRDLNELNVPCLVFSAGLGDSVVSVLKQAKVLHPNVKVVSNFLQYNSEGLLNGFQEKMIHTFNKNETALEGTDYYDLIHDRDHVIIMGDSLGDAGMADGMPVTTHILKIGFLFDHPEHNLPKYMDTFDIVLIDDQTMNIPRAILEMIKTKDYPKIF